MLGTLIERLEDETAITGVLASLDDFTLITGLQRAADAAQVPLNVFSWRAVTHFITCADDAAWLALMTTANQAADPGAACLRYMLSHELGAAASAWRSFAPA